MRASSVPSATASAASVRDGVASRRSIARLRRSGPVLALVGVALVAHVVSVIASAAINLDGSHSSRVPATPDRVALDLTIFYTANAALIATYVALLAMALRGRIHGIGRTVVLVAPVVLQVALVLPRPWLSTDVLSYLAQGFIGATAGPGTAYTAVQRDVLGTVVGDQLTALGWRPQTIMSPYGPAWTVVEILLMRVTQDVGLGILALKAVTIAASLGSAALVWRILSLVRPRLRFVGVVAFLWNPVVIGEVAAEGHVDAAMVFFALLGLYLTLRARPMAAGLAATLAALTKYLSLIVVPAQAVYLVRTADRPDLARRRLAVAGLACVALALVLFAPFWAGGRTLDGLRAMGQAGPWPTLTGTLFQYVERSYPGVDAGAIATLIVLGGFAVYLLRTAYLVRDARGLLAACARTTLAFVIVASPVFYPWYAVMPVAFVALIPERPYLAVMLALTITARIVTPLVDLRPAFEPIPAAAYTLTNLGLFACIAVAIVLGVRAVWAWAATEESPAAA